MIQIIIRNRLNEEPSIEIQNKDGEILPILLEDIELTKHTTKFKLKNVYYRRPKK